MGTNSSKRQKIEFPIHNRILNKITQNSRWQIKFIKQ